MRYNNAMTIPKENFKVLNITLSKSDVCDIAHCMGGVSNIIGSLDTIKVSRHSNDMSVERDYFILDSLNGKTFRGIMRGDVSDDELVVALSRLPPKFKHFVDEVRSVFDLPEFDIQHQAMRDAQDSFNAKQRKDVADAKARLPKITSNDELPLDKPLLKEVNQSQMGVLDENSKEQLLVTEGVGPCVVVMFINPNNHRVSMAHIASINDLRLLEDMRERVQGDIRRIVLR
jgi:hypothetical protein